MVEVPNSPNAPNAPNVNDSVSNPVESHTKPLSGIKVIDLSRLLPGPYASMLLADFGADVIKVEEPKIGDPARLMSPKIDDECAFFKEVNRNKRSLSLNLKEPKGLETFYRIIAQADVLLEGFRPGVTERLGIDYRRV